MARAIAPYGLFLGGTSIALLKLVQKLVDRNGADEWLEPSLDEDSSSTYVVEVPKILHGASSTPISQELTWRQVIDFLMKELERVDVRVWCVILLVCLLGPVARNLLGSKPPQKPYVADSKSVSTQTDQEAEPADRKDPVAIRSHHYEPAERALLQFGRSKSESVLFNYVPTDFNEEELQDFEGIVAGCTLRAEELEPVKEKEQDQEVTPRKEPEKRSSVEPPEQLKQTDSNAATGDSSGESTSVHQTSLGKSLGLLSSLKDDSLRRATSAQSLPFLPIQLSPRKTSIVEVQVNPEQVYSQPFNY